MIQSIQINRCHLFFLVGMAQFYVGRDKNGIFGHCRRYENDGTYCDLAYSNIAIIGRRSLLGRMEKILILIAHRLGIFIGTLHDAGVSPSTWGSYDGLTCIYFATQKNMTAKSFFERRITPVYTNIVLFVAEIQNFFYPMFEIGHSCHLCGIFPDHKEADHAMQHYSNEKRTHNFTSTHQQLNISIELCRTHKEIFQIGDLSQYIKQLQEIIDLMTHVSFSLNYIGAAFMSSSEITNSNNSKRMDGYYDPHQRHLTTSARMAPGRFMEIEALYKLVRNYFVRKSTDNYQSFLIG